MHIIGNGAYESLIGADNALTRLSVANNLPMMRIELLLTLL